MTTVIRFGAGYRGRSKRLHDFTRQRHWVQGRGPASKVRTLFEDAQAFRKVRILEKPEDFFEDAHLFPRCAPKTAHLRRGRDRSPVPAGSQALSRTHKDHFPERS